MNFKMKMFSMLIMLLLLTTFPSMGAIILFIISLYAIFLLISSTPLMVNLLVLIIFSTGILLLLFYLTMLNDKFMFKMKYIKFLLIFIMMPNFAVSVIYKGSLLTVLELPHDNVLMIFFVSLFIIFISLLVMNNILIYFKFVRQID